MIMIMIMIRVILISQIGLDPATGEMVEGVAQQTEVSLRNMMAIMEVGSEEGPYILLACLDIVTY